MDKLRFDFASDNTSGLCPEVLSALTNANKGYCHSYGEDRFTTEASELFRERFETDCDVYFVFNGTAANSLSLATLCQSYHGVVVHESGHVETDECGGPEFFSNGTKLLVAPGCFGKLNPDEVEKVITKRTDIHYPRPRAISISEPTELGTVYTVDEIQTLSSIAKKYQLKLHVDGARFAHAVASLKVSPADLSWRSGVDVMSFGGTKIGGLSEAVVFFNRTLSKEFGYRCKQAGQLASKMRFLAAPFIALLKNDTWLKYGAKANDLAKLLERKIRGLPQVEILYPVKANSVFVSLTPEFREALNDRGWQFYTFIGGGSRFMCSWMTSEESVNELANDFEEISSSFYNACD